ncbi:HAD family phosphatase [Patescibacteria group bacterium]|nr:HAD family phosphatase [Patescibacteria group bacterium]
MANRFSALLFDMDGLMFDTETIYSKAGQLVLEARGKNFTLDLKRQIMGLRLPEVWAYIKKYYNLPDEVPVLVKEARQAYEKYLLTDNLLQPLPGLLDLLSRAKGQRINLVLATASEKKWVELIFNKFDLASYFPTVITSEDVKFGKPHPAIYQKAVQALNLSPASCLVLEDSVNGVKAAKAAGCLVVAVPNQYTLGQDFSQADIVVSSLADKALQHYIFCDT